MGVPLSSRYELMHQPGLSGAACGQPNGGAPKSSGVCGRGGRKYTGNFFSLLNEIFLLRENTVSKYVRSLEEKGLNLTEPTMVRSKDGRPLNGELRYTICPIQAAEQDRVDGILADAYQLSGEDLRRRRTEIVQNVRKANGHIFLEQWMREAWEEDDEWRD